MPQILSSPGSVEQHFCNHDVPTRFCVSPLTENCERVVKNADHILVGVSPGNRYFSIPLLTSLLRWACEKFHRVDAIVPDSALADNFLALGYPEDRAVKKAHSEIQAVRNRIARAWAASGVPEARRHIHLLSEFTTDPAYQSLRATVVEALRDNGDIRETSLRAVRDFLRKSLGRADPTPSQVEYATHYLTAELPFILGSATIFRVASSLNFYHQPIPLARLLHLPGSALRASPNQGYALIRPTQEADAVHV